MNLYAIIQQRIFHAYIHTLTTMTAKNDKLKQGHLQSSGKWKAQWGQAHNHGSENFVGGIQTHKN